ncbi:MAG TPA: AAA-like domain-containing protein [Blastocatellia bacterium]|nr:AAA-like domain-containing protein [Blastocatellia bacterium]
MSQSKPSFFVVGGTMRHDAPSYVERKADSELLAALLRGEFCHVLTARQMGKSSLMLRTRASLRASGVTGAVIDLTAIGQNLTPEQWYAGLILQLGDRLKIEDDLLAYWHSQSRLGPMQKWVNAIRKVVLPLFAGPLVIFIDEIDAVRSLAFSTDEFFAAIRECHNLRDEDPEMQRLTFCLLGVAGVSDLIRDTRTTPFNIGRRIDLNDFTDEEALTLRDGLGKGEEQNRALLRRILYWTGGHPYLTQRVCRAVAEDASIRNARGIDKLIEELFFAKRAADHDDNLIFVREAMLRSEADVTGLLQLYSKIRRKRSLTDDDTNPLVGILALSGITRSEKGRLRVRNRIYERAFDDSWIKASLPGFEVRRQRDAYRRGLLRAVTISTIILAFVIALALVALNQRNRAKEEALSKRRLSYDAQMNVALQELELGLIDRVEDLLAATTALPGEEDLRGFEWHLLWSATHNDVFHLKNKDPIGAVRFLEDNSTLAIVESQHTKADAKSACLVKPYDTRLRSEVSISVPAGNGFDVVLFSADKRYLVADGPNNSINIWDIHSGTNIASLHGHLTTITAAALSADMRRLVSADQDGVITIWDVATQKAKLSLKGSRRVGTDEADPVKTHWIRGVDISPDGRLAAISDGTRRIRILNIDSGMYEQPFEIDDGSLIRTVFSPGKNSLVATAVDGRLYVWDLATRRRIASRAGHTNEISSFSFSPDGKRLATGSLDRTIRLWDLTTWREIETIRGHGSWVTALDWSPDGKYLVSGGRDGAVKIWDISIKSLPVLPREKVASYYATVFSPTDELLALGRTTDLYTKVWNLSTGEELLRLDGPGETTLCAVFSNDAKLVAAGGMDRQVKVWEVSTGKLVTKISGREAFYGINFSPDGSLLVTGDKDGEVKVWEVSTGSELANFTSSNSYFRAVFSPDGKMIATAGRDGVIKLWEIASKTELREFTGHLDRVRTIAFSADGRIMATGAKDNTVRLWEVATGKELSLLGRSDSIERAVFSADGRRLVTGGLDGLVKLWDLTTMQEVATLRREGDEVNSMTFSREFSALVVSGNGGVVKVWQAKRDATRNARTE